MTNLNKNKLGILGRKATKVVLAVFMVSIIILNSGMAFADELSDQIDAKKNQLNFISQQINQIKNELAQKQKEISTLKSQMDAMDSQIELTQLQIKSSQIEIEKTGAEIDKTEKDIKDNEEELARQKDTVNSVLKELYKEQDSSMLEVILGSTNFSEMVDRTEYLSRIRSQIKDTIDKLGILKAELKQKKTDLEKKKTGLEELKKQKESEQSDLENQQYSKAKIMEMTRGQESAYQAKLAQQNAEEQAANAEITRLVQEQARRKRAEGVAGRDGRDQVVNTGGFSYPLAGLNRISITGGDFRDPAYGMGFPHTGVDLAARQGTPIMAAGVGSVVIAHDSGGGGLSYIAIDHGNGLISKYLHMSAVYVRTGDVVNAGDVIGLSGGNPGSRGAGAFTTGAHLHFEIDDYNGNALNPHNYLNIAPPIY